MAGIFLFTKIFDHFAVHVFSIWSVAAIDAMSDLLRVPFDKYYVSNVFLLIVNIIVSLFLIIKAEWIAARLIKKNDTITIDLNSKSLTKIILLTTSVIWIAQSIYLLPQAIEFFYSFIKTILDNWSSSASDFEIMPYLLRFVLALIFILRIDKITNWITKKI
ncbi:MAG: hypothetical protein ACSHWW_03940 [Nonlabens sp.]|uniref:hypothetical protein n=1 Tax=Nonlabens sp. TaxID=1888209 RepID=UPI003EF4A4E9